MIKISRSNSYFIALAVIGAALLGCFAFFRSAPVDPLKSSGQTEPFLPNGAVLNTKPLDDNRFKVLLKPIYPQVQPDEVGNANPFATATDASSAAQPLVNTPVQQPQKNPFVGRSFD